MEQILNIILGQASFNQTTVARPNVETIQAKISLIQKLETIPTAHNFISDFHTETVQTIKTLTTMMETVGIDLTDEQLDAINNKIDGIINDMENEIKNKISSALGGLGLGALNGLIH